MYKTQLSKGHDAPMLLLHGLVKFHKHGVVQAVIGFFLVTFAYLIYLYIDFSIPLSVKL